MSFLDEMMVNTASVKFTKTGAKLELRDCIPNEGRWERGEVTVIF